jgi:RNA polymerase sigma factor (sigma-70 family)
LLRVLQRYQVDPLTDGQLLERFVTQRDETSFEVLLRRHGPAVHGLCRRTLGNEHDAEDAFQATFLVLARKAASIGRREALASWLYAVAYRLALRARARAQRRRLYESQVPPPIAACAEPGWELRAILDEELSRLPEKYRAAIVLCCVEGRSRVQAADELGCSPSAVKIRLERARQVLRGRLMRRGLGVPATLLTALLAECVGVVPAAWAEAAIRAGPLFAVGAKAAGVVSSEAVSLACGGLMMLSLTKVKILSVLFLALSLSGSAAFWTRADAQQPPGVEKVVRVIAEQGEDPPGQPGAAPVRVKILQKKALAEAQPSGDTIEIETVAGELAKALQALQKTTTAQVTIYSKDKKLIALQQGDKLSILDAATGKILWKSEVPRDAKVTFSEDGKNVNATIQLEVHSGKTVGKFWTKLDDNTLTTLQKLAASEDTEIRRLANELLHRLGAGAPRPVQTKAVWQVVTPAKPAAPGMLPQPASPPALEQRLDRLIQELQELRRQVHGKDLPKQ